MKRRVLGRTGLEVSEIGLGTVEIGLEYHLPGAGSQRPSRAEAERILHGALDLGINLIDTARAYGDSEAIIGEVLAGRRAEFILCSKVEAAAEDEDAVMRSVEASCAKLRTDCIDVMFLHRASLEVLERGATTAGLMQAREKGLIRFAAASTYGPDEAERALDDGRFDCLQIAYNALDRWPELSLFERCLNQGVGIVARSVLLRGILTDRPEPLPPALSGVASAAASLAGQGMPLAELAYRYVLNAPAVSVALVGAAHHREVAAAAGFADAGPLPPGFVSTVRAVSLADPRQLDPRTWPTA
ncbi:MAG: aldo/keto reductase [Acidobacteria bacterium]|nr:aldo/keto reductase [Acidobacteriota bacterium]